MKRQIIITGFIFLAISVIGISIYYFRAGEKTGKFQTKEIRKLNCEDIIDVKEKDDCLAGVVKLLNSENNAVCESLISEADKSACRQAYIIKEAAEASDLKKCDQLTDKALAADCSAQASFSLAIQKKDKKYCENITNKTDKENCLAVLAGLGVK